MRSALRYAAAVLALAAPAATAAQDWQRVTSFRQRGDESRLDVHVRYGAGQLSVKPGTGAELYRVGIRYDADVFDPVTEYRNGRLEVGVEGHGDGIKLEKHETGTLELALSPAVPLDLDLDFGAVEARLELGGLRLSRIDVETGASDTDLRFSAPNPIECDRLNLTIGAASFSAEGIANANCARVQVEGGVGDVTLDFTGQWRRSIEADLTMALGSVTLVIPEDIGVRVDKDTFLVDFDDAGFAERDGVYYSRNWDAARHRIEVRLEGAFGDVNVRWTGPSDRLTP